MLTYTVVIGCHLIGCTQACGKFHPLGDVTGSDYINVSLVGHGSLMLRLWTSVPGLRIVRCSANYSSCFCTRSVK